jgi:hypothetical protein
MYSACCEKKSFLFESFVTLLSHCREWIGWSGRKASCNSFVVVRRTSPLSWRWSVSSVSTQSLTRFFLLTAVVVSPRLPPHTFGPNAMEPKSLLANRQTPDCQNSADRHCTWSLEKFLRFTNVSTRSCPITSVSPGLTDSLWNKLTQGRTVPHRLNSSRCLEINVSKHH